jgi:DNA-binding beta-propeller fold protein YncE
VSIQRSVSMVLLASVIVLLILCVGVASAEVPRLLPNGSFASEGAFGVAVDNSCSLHVPSLSGSACEAFDSSANDVFTAGFLRVREGELVGLGVPIRKFDASGHVLPPSPFAEGFHYGAAVNPTNGHLYVVSEEENTSREEFCGAVGTPCGEIATYDPNTGQLLSSFAVPFAGGLFGELFNGAQIATDSAGAVYVPIPPSNEVLKYSETGALLETFTGPAGHELKGPTGVAVDSSGDVWVADRGNNRVVELSPTDTVVSEFASEGVRGLALDAQGDVFAVVDNGADNCGTLPPPCAHLVEYNASGAQLADVGAGYFGGTTKETGSIGSLVMMARDEATGRVYVADDVKGVVWIFDPPLAPVLGQESAVEVGTSEAKLGVLVNPGGLHTTYRFEYDTRAYAEGEGPHGVSTPFPEGDAGEGFGVRTVWAGAKGLAPGTTYHYRAIATNGLGTVMGRDQTFTTLTTAQVACPNEDVRGGFSAALPDCRAYELVSPLGGDSAQPDTEHGFGGPRVGNYAAENGDRYSYTSVEVMPGSQTGGLEFIATRGANGWSSEDALPLQPYTGDRCNLQFPSSFVVGYSADLSRAVIVVNAHKAGEASLNPPNVSECESEALVIAPGEPVGEENLLLRDNENGTYQLVNVTPAGVIPTLPSFVAASVDRRTIVFSERARLTPDAESNRVNLYEWREGVVRLLRFLLPSGTPVEGSFVSISPDGGVVFFTAAGKLYARLDHGERTAQVDEARRGGSGPGGGGSLAAVTADGSEVFFTDDAAAGLTADTVPGSATNLYRYDVTTGQLSDLTPISEAKASFIGASEDGSYVYFSSDGVQSGSQPNQFGETPENGKANFYFDHDGTITFIMHGGGGPISSNGAFLAFGSEGEIHIYSAQANRFKCASCNPDGEAPTEGVTFSFAAHPVSDNGQVFFETSEALLPRDTDGVKDVYEYDWNSGLQLISAGTSASGSLLLAATPSGNDVFFLTRQKLLPQDNLQEAAKIYDARVGGGFPEIAVPPECTTADACRAAASPQPSIYGAPSSQTFSGAGNLSSQAKVKSKKRHRFRGRIKHRMCRHGKHGRARCATRTGGKAGSRQRGGK